MPIEWRDKMSVGNAIIDEDHRHLIDLINEYEAAIQNHDLHLLEHAFDGLMSYARTHFHREENLQAAIHYPHRLSHKEQHEKLVKEIEGFHQALKNKDGKKLSVAEISQFLRSWLVDHVLHEDMKMAPLLTGQRDQHRAP